MKAKHIRYDFTIPLYEAVVSVYIAESMSDNIIAVNKDFKLNAVNDNSQAKSMQFSNDKETKFAMLFTEHENLVQVIVHESLHISWYICEYVGIGLTPKNHEAQAYILEYVVSKVNGFLI
ncbi:MAG: hypothetical protein ACTSO3_13560 [Candidatus Heimdallarchaeaceae archaeon]